MPTYDYKCNNCNSQVEVTRSFDQDGDPMCTGCNSTMSRVWQATPAIFRGGGWGGKQDRLLVWTDIEADATSQRAMMSTLPLQLPLTKMLNVVGSLVQAIKRFMPPLVVENVPGL